MSPLSESSQGGGAAVAERPAAMDNTTNTAPAFASADADLEAILALPKGGILSRILFDAAEVMPDALYPHCTLPDLFTRVLTAFRGQRGDWLLQVFEIGCNTFEVGGLDYEGAENEDATETGGTRLWASSPREVERGLARIRAETVIHRLRIEDIHEETMTDRADDETEVLGLTLVSNESEDAIAKILALREGDTYVEPGRGPCVNSDGEHDLATGYSWHEWRVNVLFEKGCYTFSVESRCEDSSWKASDFGMMAMPGSNAFEWYADADGVPRTLKTMRALRDQEEGDYDDPVWRQAQGITDSHFLRGTLSDATRAELTAETQADLKVAA